MEYKAFEDGRKIRTIRKILPPPFVHIHERKKRTFQYLIASSFSIVFINNHK